MAYFAKVENGIVVKILVADQAFIDAHSAAGEKWVETVYSPDTPVPGTVLRKNCASVGGIYDEARDAFYLKQPFPSWVLDETDCTWDAPVPAPTDKAASWNEAEQKWILLE
jgi:hypothetical protein